MQQVISNFSILNNFCIWHGFWGLGIWTRLLWVLPAQALKSSCWLSWSPVSLRLEWGWRRHFHAHLHTFWQDSLVLCHMGCSWHGFPQSEGETEWQKLRQKSQCLYNAISENIPLLLLHFTGYTNQLWHNVYKRMRLAGSRDPWRQPWILSQPNLISFQGPWTSHLITAVIQIPESHHLSLGWVQITFPRCHSLSIVPFDLKACKGERSSVPYMTNNQ